MHPGAFACRSYRSTLDGRDWTCVALALLRNVSARAPFALVTGASSGIGAACARQLSKDGYTVGLVATSEMALKEVASGLSGPAVILPTNLTDADQLRALEQALGETEPAVSLLVNNAATGSYGPFVDHDPEGLSETVLLNVVTVMRLTRAVLPKMIAAGRGGIINVSSPVSQVAAPRVAPYAATKAAVDSLTRTLRVELRGTGIVLTLVRPDWTRTGFHARLGQDVTGVPDRKWQSPEAVATAALAAHRRGRAVVRIPTRTLRDVAREGLRQVVPQRVKSVMHRSG
jgi:short-subunit dehydrogenase